MLYREPFMLAIPRDLWDDQELSMLHKVAFALMTKHTGKNEVTNNGTLAEQLGIKYSRLKEIKQDLAAKGHLVKVTEQNQTRYVTADNAALAWDRLKLFRKYSKEGFDRITDEQITILQAKHTTDKILYTLEVLEHTYRKSNKKQPDKPFHLLRSCLSKNLTPDSDFKRGFWEHDAQKAAAVKAAKVKNEQAEKKRAEEQRGASMEILQFMDRLTEGQRKAAKDLAHRRLVERGVPKAFINSYMLFDEIGKIKREGVLIV